MILLHTNIVITVVTIATNTTPDLGFIGGCLDAGS